jgi:hypothetical protein
LSETSPLIELYLALSRHWGAQFHESTPCGHRVVKCKAEHRRPDSCAAYFGFYVHLLDDRISPMGPQR